MNKVYRFVFFQKNWPITLPEIAMYDLLEDIKDHPKGSTVSEQTLRKAGVWEDA